MKGWNSWRSENPDVEPDLSGANLSHTHLVEADLSAAHLGGADLSHADLNGGSFFYAHLIGSRLDGANLTGANFDMADLRVASFKGANLQSAEFLGANLRSANFQGADLSRARVGGTIFDDLDLSSVIGLDTVIHHGPSTVGIDTVFLSNGIISESFLRGAGVPDDFVVFVQSLTGHAIEFYSCFLSHAEPDGAFADRLRSDLIANKVSCWHYRYDMRGGQFWRAQIDDAIKVHDKIILICSKTSIQRRNVIDEVVTAIQREREIGSQKLFPIRLDDFVLSDEMLEVTDRKVAAGEWREDWVRYVRAYHIPDFKAWRQQSSYEAEFQKLLGALKSPARR